ncbi:hypothetical protein [Salinilacihabitans rarus]|uniref:hypothetical protein n=1 Tax=Salinilacihabitans rarus TaxID=2961596 RepID=UPI0020C8C1EF|nr:hypothetical protein [Salinilacihabitans rarus]
MTVPGLTPTQQVPASAAAAIDLDTQPVTALWEEVISYDDVADTFVRALRAFAAGKTVPELYAALDERDVPRRLWSWIRDVGLGNRRSALWLTAKLLPNLGQVHSSTADLFATARLFECVSETGTPTRTLAFIVDRAFEDADRRKRVDVCRLLSILARAFDVRLVASGVTEAFLRTQHREDLPGVSEWRDAHRDVGPLAEVVDAATARLDPDGRDVQVLRALADEPSETLAYGQLYGLFPAIDDSRVRQCVGRLADLELVATFGPRQDRKVELLEAGRRVLETFDAKIGRQRRLDESVSETGKSSPQCRVTPRTGGEGEDGPQPYEVGWMGRPGHAAAAACGRPGGVTLVRGRLPDGDGRTHEVSYDADRDEAVVAVRAAEPLPYVVSVAVALATPWFLDAVLPSRRLEQVVDREPPAILRDARCIGALSDEALADPTVLRDELVAWGQRLQDLTVDLRNGEYDDRDAFRAAIMRSAHGLAGSIVHLLDVAGVDLVREVRVPAGVDRDDLDALAKSMAISAAIQSRYAGVHNAYRHLFESRPEKRAAAFTPEVDAADPVGRLIGSFVVRGEDVHRLRPALEECLARPQELHEDAPEFVVSVPITEVGRAAHVAVANRLLLPKRIRPTDASVTLVHALVPDPYAAARALHQLGAEDQPRDLRLGELRYALGTLDAADLLPDLPPTVGKVVSALLVAEAPLTQRALADAAGVSTRSVRTHRHRLTSLGLVEATGAGLRLALPFADERGDDVRPALLKGALLVDAVDALLVATLSPERYADPDDPLGGVLFDLPGDPADPWRLVDDADLGSWVALAGRLTAMDRPDAETAIAMGPAIEQAPLPTVGDEEVISA